MSNRLLCFARIAHEVASHAVPERAHRFAPQRYTQPQLLACLLVKTYLNLDYRTAQETLELSDGLRDALGLTVVPDYSTLWRFAHDKATADVFARALEETITRFKASSKQAGAGPDPPVLVAIDSTGMFCGRASRYFEQRRSETSCEHRKRAYQKWAAALWTAPQLVTAQLSKPGPCGDYPDLPPLASVSARSVERMIVLADAGYDCESNHVYCRERLGVRALIPAKTRRYVAGPRRRYRSEMVQLLGCATLGAADEVEAQRTYRQRWLVETLMSVVKRKWGEALRARSERMQRLEALVRGVVYNVHRLVVLGVAAAST